MEARRKLSDDPDGIIAEPVDRARYAWYDPTCPCGLPPGDCKEHPRARATQRPPEGDWSRWFLMAGRGFGKTKAGAEWVRHLAETGQAERIALMAPTAAAIRNVMIEGKSGILAVCPPWFRPVYAPSLQRVTWPNGVIAECYSADEPERLRGPEHGQPGMITVFDDILHLRDRPAACLFGNGPALPQSSCHRPDFAARDVSRHRPPSHLRFTHG
jgi:hypothetical protein